MSRGPGRAQRAITAIFDASPARRFTVSELASSIHGASPTASQIESTRQSITKLAPVLNLKKCRVGTATTGGWHHAWGR